jgi:hypothetical protein
MKAAYDGHLQFIGPHTVLPTSLASRPRISIPIGMLLAILLPE